MITLEKHYLHAVSPQALNRLLIKFNHRHNINSPQIVNNGQHNNINNTRSSNKSISIVVPYTKGLSESFQKTFDSVGIQVHFEDSNTICPLFTYICQKVGTYTGLNAHAQSAQKNTYGNQGGPLGTD